MIAYNCLFAIPRDLYGSLSFPLWNPYIGFLWFLSWNPSLGIPRCPMNPFLEFLEMLRVPKIPFWKYYESLFGIPTNPWESLFGFARPATIPFGESLAIHRVPVGISSDALGIPRGSLGIPYMVSPRDSLGILLHDFLRNCSSLLYCTSSYFDTFSNCA